MCTTQDNLFLKRKYNRRLRVIKLVMLPHGSANEGGGVWQCGKRLFGHYS
jgi:hypothetical protein